MLEVNVCDESLLHTAWRRGRISLDERLWQSLLEQCDAVYVPCESILLVYLVILRTFFLSYHITKIEVSCHTSE